MNFRIFSDKSSNTYQAFWVAMGSLSSFALSIVSAAILSRYFDKSEYGTYRQILYVYNTLLVIFMAGLPSVFAYFLPRFALSQGKDIVQKVTNVLFLTGLLFSLTLFIFSNLIATILKNPELTIGLKYFSPIPMLLLPTLGIEGIFSTYKRTIFIAIYDTLSRVLMLLFIVVPVIVYKGTYLSAIYGWIIASVLTLGAAYYFKNIPFKGVIAEKSQLTIREILKYSLPIASASIAGIAIKSADQFYISRYFGTEVFAEFSNGFIQLPFVGMITGATATVLMPVFSKIIFDKSSKDQLINLWQSALQKSAIIIYPMVFFFIFYARETITILYSDIYIRSSQYFIVALTINFFNIILFAPILLAMGKSKFYAQLHIVFAICTWIGGYLVVILFNTPLAIAVFSALMTSSIIFFAMRYVKIYLHVSFLDLVPVKQLFLSSLQSLGCIMIVKFLTTYLSQTLSTVYVFIAALGGYVFLMLLTARLFRINYKGIIMPLLNR